MFSVLFRKQCFLCGNTPVNSKTIIYYRNTSINFWMVELVTLILKDCRFTQHGKAVREATGNKELAMVIFGQFHSNVLAISGTPLANINCNIKNSSLYATNQFTLGERRCLKMQATHHAIAGHTFIILNEVDCMTKNGRHLLIKLSPGEAFKEVSSFIAKDLWLYDQYAINSGFYYFHILFVYRLLISG